MASYNVTRAAGDNPPVSPAYKKPTISYAMPMPCAGSTREAAVNAPEHFRSLHGGREPNFSPRTAGNLASTRQGPPPERPPRAGTRSAAAIVTPRLSTRRPISRPPAVKRPRANSSLIFFNATEIVTNPVLFFSCSVTLQVTLSFDGLIAAPDTEDAGWKARPGHTSPVRRGRATCDGMLAGAG